MKSVVSKHGILWVASLAAAALVPLLVGEYLRGMMILICIWVIMTMSINLIYGYTGQLSLGHSAFFAMGAYAMGLLAVKAGLAFWPAFLLSVGITGVAGILLGYTSLRLKGPYFVLVTLSFAIILHVVLVHWEALTGGANGLMGIPRPPAILLPFGVRVTFQSQLSMYYLILFFLVLATLSQHRLVNSLAGRGFVAVSKDETLAQSLGINTMRCKLTSFVISTLYAGAAGSFYAAHNSVITPHVAHFTQGMNAVAYLVIGGSATMSGPFLGTIVLLTLPEGLQVLPRLMSMINGAVLLTFLVFLPSGIAGGLGLVLKKWNVSRKRAVTK